MAIYTNLPVYEDCYQLMLRFSPISIRMQRDYRYTLGVYVKPYRNYICNGSKRRMKRKIMSIGSGKNRNVVHSVNSYLGILRHVSSYRLRRRMFGGNPRLSRLGRFDAAMLRFTACK